MMINSNENNCNFLIKPKQLKGSLENSELFATLLPLVSICKKSDFLKKVDEICSNNDEIKRLDTGFFSFQDKQIFEYLPTSKIQTAKTAYERGKQIGNPLTDYKLTILDNTACNSFCIFDFNNSNNYSFEVEFDEIDSKTKKDLFDNIKALARQGVKFDPNALMYNPTDGKFKLINFSEVATDGFYTPEARNEYLKAYSEFLKL